MCVPVHSCHECVRAARTPMPHVNPPCVCVCVCADAHGIWKPGHNYAAEPSADDTFYDSQADSRTNSGIHPASSPRTKCQPGAPTVRPRRGGECGRINSWHTCGPSCDTVVVVDRAGPGTGQPAESNGVLAVKFLCTARACLWRGLLRSRCGLSPLAHTHTTPMPLICASAPLSALPYSRGRV